MTPKIKAFDLPDFDMAEYLQTDEDVASYLTLVLAENDHAELTYALGTIACVCTALGVKLVAQQMQA
jgi:probable addiction module antidote protein